MRIISGSARGTKLYTLDNKLTRPTLDRVKESVFNILQKEIIDATVLDLFSGSGAIGLEAASRGANKVILCDKSKDAAEIIKKNINKTHLEDKIELYNTDFISCLNQIEKEKFDIVYLDPPYDTNLVKKSLEQIIELGLIKESSIIVIETDNKKRIIRELENLEIKIIDERKYGRAEIIFLKYSKHLD